MLVKLTVELAYARLKSRTCKARDFYLMRSTINVISCAFEDEEVYNFMGSWTIKFYQFQYLNNTTYCTKFAKRWYFK